MIAGAGSGRAPGPPCVAKAVAAAAIAATGPCRYPVTGDLGALRLRANWQYVPRPRAIVAKPEIALDEHVFVTTQMNPRFRRYKEGPNPSAQLNVSFLWSVNRTDSPVQPRQITDRFPKVTDPVPKTTLMYQHANTRTTADPLKAPRTIPPKPGEPPTLI